MTEISIALTSLSDFKAINVEGLGIINVRRESSNQATRSSENIRDIFKLQDEAKRLEKKSKELIDSGTKDDDPEVVKLNEKSTEKLEKITEIRVSEMNMRKSRLSDNEGGKLVEKLFDLASDEDIAKLFALADGKNDE